MPLSGEACGAKPGDVGHPPLTIIFQGRKSIVFGELITPLSAERPVIFVKNIHGAERIYSPRGLFRAPEESTP
jgi:hypothetical protein